MTTMLTTEVSAGSTVIITIICLLTAVTNFIGLKTAS